MTLNTLAKLQTQAAPTVSDSYVFLSTEQAHEVLAEFGFFESKYRQGKGTGFQKHLSIFERDTDNDEDGRFNLLLLNSHNGTSSLRLEAGYFRVLCENQLGSGDIGIRVAHRGQALDRFADAIPLVLQQMQKFRETKQLLRDKTLNDDARWELARFALELRGVGVTGLDDYQLTRNIQNMLTSRRYEDRGLNAWKMFNVVQENVVKGGIRLYQNTGTIEQPKDVLRKARALTSAERLLDVNNQLTQRTIELVQAA